MSVNRPHSSSRTYSSTTIPIDHHQQSVRLVSYRPAGGHHHRFHQSLFSERNSTMYESDAPTDHGRQSLGRYENSVEITNKELDELISYFVDHAVCPPITNVDETNGDDRPNGILIDMAFKFLFARNLKVERALAAHYEYERMRRREGLQLIWLNEPSLFGELQSSKFSVLPVQFRRPIVIIFSAKSHLTSKTPTLLTLRCFICHLDSVMESHPEARQWGVRIVYDMSHTRRENFDYNLGRKFVKLLKDAYPAVLNGFYVVCAPPWFQSAYKVKYVNKDEMSDILKGLFPVYSIPTMMGGEWDEFADCHDRHARYVRVLLDQTNPSCSRHYTLQKPVGYRLSMSAMVQKPESVLVETNIPERISRRSTFAYASRLGINAFFDRISNNDTFWWSSELKREFEEATRTGIDQSRVVLKNSLDGSDYIHANFVDGADVVHEYINTQGPMDSTLVDFWQMIWEQQVRVIVMVTKTIERGVLKCSQYWPLMANESEQYGDSFVLIFVLILKERKSGNELIVENISNGQLKGALRDCRCGLIDGSSNSDDFGLTILRLSNINDPKTSRILYHLQFLTWPDYGVPDNADSIIALRQAMKNLQNGLDDGDVESNSLVVNRSHSPIVVHCSAGIGRTGTFCTIDICLNSFETSIRRLASRDRDVVFNQATLLSIPEVLILLRGQRAHSIQNGEQYAFCYKAIATFINTKLTEDDEEEGF
ncbi:hypothetical protein ACOME3_009720 [Neoechinorhynchus agilis]